MLVVRFVGDSKPKSITERRLNAIAAAEMKSKEAGNGNGMKRKWMKGRITRIKHREISVPSAARFYGRQSMTRVVARARMNEQKPEHL